MTTREEFECEYGSIGNVNFINAVMYSKEDNVLLCACGKPAISGAVGKESFISWCSDCDPSQKYEATLVYKQSTIPNSKMKFAGDDWTINLRDHHDT